MPDTEEAKKKEDPDDPIFDTPLEKIKAIKDTETFTKKDGTPGYFQEYEKSKGNLKGYETHGYVVIAPHIELKIPGFGEMSGTTLRAALATADQKTFKDIMGFFDLKIYWVNK